MFSTLLKLTALALMGLESATTATPAPAKLDLHPVEQAIIDGTNAEQGRAILEAHASDRLTYVPTMLDAARKAVELARAGS